VSEGIPAVSLVVFDLGRVLIRLCDGWQHACKLADVKLPSGVAAASDADRARIEELAALVDTGAIDLATYAREIAPLRGLRPDDILAMQEIFLRGAYPGAADLIDELHAAGTHTACLSNTHDHHWRQMLDPAGSNFLPLERMTYRFASHLVRTRKPLDAIYEHVERTTGLPPQSILFFDDLEANVAAAARRGWQTHRVTSCDDPIPAIHHRLRSLQILT
jgi:FMN phosphatase YigB (HAD superfamily)